MRLYDRRVGRATGSTPIKQHSNENVAETHAVEQRKDYRINVSSIPVHDGRRVFNATWLCVAC